MGILTWGLFHWLITPADPHMQISVKGAAAMLLDEGTVTAVGSWSTGSGHIDLQVTASAEQLSLPRDICSFLKSKSCNQVFKVLSIMVTGASHIL